MNTISRKVNVELSFKKDRITGDWRRPSAGKKPYVFAEVRDAVTGEIIINALRDYSFKAINERGYTIVTLDASKVMSVTKAN